MPAADAAAASADDVHDACGEDIREQFAEFQRRERRLLGRLQHDRVAGGKRGAEFPGGHHQRVIPGCDRGDDADWVAADHAGETCEVFAGDGARQRAACAGEEPEDVRDRGNLVVERGCERLAAVLRLDLRECSPVRFDAIGQLQQQVRSILRRSARPAGECGIRRLHGRVDLSARGLGHASKHLARRRVQHVLDLAFTRDEFAVDQESGLHV
jgi:hypothetical protein